MPVYKDEERGTWYASFYYTNWQGERKKKKKRGFKKRSEAKDWETQFLAKCASDPTMTFQSLYELYMEDAEKHVRHDTFIGKRMMFEKHILPFFAKRKINEITAADIRRWQNELLSAVSTQTGQPYSETYLRTLNGQLSAAFNFAVQYHNLQKNPCYLTKSIGSHYSGEMEFWTLDEFNTFIEYEQKPAFHLLFMILFWCGLRAGEALALTPEKVLHDIKALNITETYHRREGEDVLGPTKTRNSIRRVAMPDFVYDELSEYLESVHGIKDDERIFYFTKSAVNQEFKFVTEKAGVKRIRVHDLRHSHVSLLIELGYSTLAIADRIGDTPGMVDRTYAHLYPTVATSIAVELNRHQHGIQKQPESVEYVEKSENQEPK